MRYIDIYIHEHVLGTSSLWGGGLGWVWCCCCCCIWFDLLEKRLGEERREQHTFSSHHHLVVPSVRSSLAPLSLSFFLCLSCARSWISALLFSMATTTTTTTTTTTRVFGLALLLLLACPPFFQVVKCQSDSDADIVADVLQGAGGADLGIVDDDVQDFGNANFIPAQGVDTVCIFPKNAGRLVPAGEETELLVGVNNDGDSNLNVISIKASLHLPFDHHLLVQNLTVQEFSNSSVQVSAQATFPYMFAVNKYLQPGTFDLVGTIIYEIDQKPYQSTFYNGTIEVVEASGFLSIESVFLVTLGTAIAAFLVSWAYGQLQQISKKTKRAAAPNKVEVGTGTTDANMDEWLQGTAYAKSLSSKSKKK